MRNIESRWQQSHLTPKGLDRDGRLVAGSPLLHAQIDPAPVHPHKRTPGLNEMVTAFDFEPVMFANVPQSVYDYTAHGDGGECNLRRNRQAFDWVDILPGTSVDPSTRRSLVGAARPQDEIPDHDCADGDAGRAASRRRGRHVSRGDQSANTPMCLSNNSSQSIEKVAKGAPGQLWWQFYPRQDMGASQELLERAQAAGYKAMVITVDQQASYYERSQHDRNLGGRTGGAGAGRAEARRCGGQGGAGRANDPEALGTATIGRGAAVPGSAAAGAPVRRGAAAYRLGGGRLWYSWEYLDEDQEVHQDPDNHQGHRHRGRCAPLRGARVRRHRRVEPRRPIDGLRAVDARSAARDRRGRERKIPVMIDSGFRRGSDILKALALGADAVWLGRASRWALGAFGPLGVQRLLTEIMFKELVAAAAYAGKTTLASIDSRIVKQNWP